MHIMDDAMAAARDITANAAKHRHRVELDVGDYALLRADRIATDAERHHTAKLHTKYRGPFLVTTKMDFDNYACNYHFTRRTQCSTSATIAIHGHQPRGHATSRTDCRGPLHRAEHRQTPPTAGPTSIPGEMEGISNIRQHLRALG